MPRIYHTISHGLGSRKDEKLTEPSKNHYKQATKLAPELQAKIASMDLVRVAGNSWVCPSSKDFWAVSNGKIKKITSDEVDNGETLGAAPADDPSSYLDDILGDLSW
jgi:hypothetical protein